MDLINKKLFSLTPSPVSVIIFNLKKKINEKNKEKINYIGKNKI